MQNTVLMLIDLQNDYFPGGKFSLPNILPAAENCKKILKAARDHHVPVVHIRHEFLSPESPFFAINTHGVEINEIVKPKENEHIVVKHHINSFKETKLKEILDCCHCKKIIIIGAMSQMCIDAAVRAASDMGYEVTVAHDGVASQQVDFNGIHVSAEMVQASFLNSLSFAYAQVIDTQAVIAQLQGQ